MEYEHKEWDLYRGCDCERYWFGDYYWFDVRCIKKW